MCILEYYIPIFRRIEGGWNQSAPPPPPPPPGPKKRGAGGGEDRVKKKEFCPGVLKILKLNKKKQFFSPFSGLAP